MLHFSIRPFTAMMIGDTVSVKPLESGCRWTRLLLDAAWPDVTAQCVVVDPGTLLIDSPVVTRELGPPLLASDSPIFDLPRGGVLRFSNGVFLSIGRIGPCRVSICASGPKAVQVHRWKTYLAMINERPLRRAFG
jgi:hypothetical protein